MFEMPKTYNQILRYTRCMSLKEFVPSLTQDEIVEMYNFLNENYHNEITLTSEMISLTNEDGKIVKAIPLNGIGNLSFDKLVIGSTLYQVFNVRRGSSDSGCSGCGGCSSNNNNNNNNNNNG